MPEATESWVWLARIRRPQGRKGEVFCDILTDFPEKFSERRQLWLIPAPESHQKTRPVPHPSGASATDGWESTNLPSSANIRAVSLAAHWLHKGGIVLHFAGIDSISAAEALKGMIVAIPRAERAALPEDEVYVGDLIGCVLVDLAGAEPATVGEIEDVDRSGGAAPLLVVRGAKGEVLVPFAKSYLRKIDLAGKRVEMALPVGLVDLSEAEEA
ncbi:MAG TPA: ribosome maturation factor RimM [Terracidiphilus sp.]|nr:ribosome maturation factor RimM [Terracidiphilus sp.]